MVSTYPKAAGDDNPPYRYQNMHQAPPMAVASGEMSALSEGVELPLGASIGVSQEIDFIVAVQVDDICTSGATVSRKQTRA